MAHEPVVISRKVELELRECPACGAFVALASAQWERRQSGKDAVNDNGFYCPNGHQYGWWESAEDRQKKLTEAAQAEVRKLAAQRDGLLGEINQRVRERDAARTALAKAAHRGNAGVCLHCHRTFSQLARHMVSKHPDKLEAPNA